MHRQNTRVIDKTFDELIHQIEASSFMDRERNDLYARIKELEELIIKMFSPDTYEDADLLSEIKRYVEVTYKYRLTEFFTHDKAQLFGCSSNRNDDRFYRMITIVLPEYVAICCINRGEKSTTRLIRRVKGKTVSDAGNAINEMIKQLEGSQKSK